MSFFRLTWLFTKYSYTEARTRLVHFILTLLSCIIVVTVAAVIKTSLNHAPLVFLRLSEGVAGEVDIRLVPWFHHTYLNYTRVLNVAEATENLTPRVIFSSASVQCSGCASNKEDVEIVFINTNKEEDIELGRQYELGALELGKCHIHRKLAKSLGKGEGDTIQVNFNQQKWFEAVYAEFTQNTESVSPWLFLVSGELEIAELFDSTEGKFPDSSSQSVVLAEIESLFYLYREFIGSTAQWSQISDASEFKTHLETARADWFSTEIIGNMPSPRSAVYMDQNYDSIQNTVTSYASALLDQVGFYPVELTLPVLQELRQYRFASVFLGLILNMILFVLFMLSVILIYSLLMVTVETKTFELGVFQVLGLGKCGLVWLILITSMLFILPAIIVGMALSVVGNTIVSGMFEQTIGIGFDPIPTAEATVFAVLIGLLMPLLAGLSPLMSVLNSELSHSLDTSHSKSKAVSITIDPGNSAIKLSLIYFGVITVLFGVTIYIMLPLALLSFNLSLVLGIFFAILIGFLLGLVLLVINIQYLFERLVVYIVLFLETLPMRKLVLKNLSAHRLRNRKTTIMYALALAFIIFISVSYEIQVSTSLYSNLRKNGARLVVSTDQWKKGPGLSISLEEILERYSDIIDNYAWATKALEPIVETAEEVFISNLGKIYQFNTKVVGVSPSFFDTVIEDFLIIGEQDETTGLSLSEQLYTARGSQSGLLSTVFMRKLALSLDKDDHFLVRIDQQNGNFYRVIRPLAFLDSAAGLSFSKYSTSPADVVVSIPTYLDLAGEWAPDIDSIPLGRLFIKLVGGEDDRVDDLYLELSRAIENVPDSSIWDYRTTQESQEETAGFMRLLFTVVTVIAMFLCFFSLASTMTANMLEQTKEISVLRATGMRKLRIALLYVYEAFVLIFVAGVMGLFIGMCVAWTMWAQQVMFTDLLVPFVFPWQITIGIFFGSAACAFLSSFGPAYRMVKVPISELMRKNN